jgi:hypothetical protein
MICSLERWRGGNLVIVGQDFAGAAGDRGSIRCCTCLPGPAVPGTSGNGLPLHCHLPEPRYSSGLRFPMTRLVSLLRKTEVSDGVNVTSPLPDLV